MNLQDMAKIVEVNSADKAQKYVDAGWKMIFAGQFNDGETAYTTYSLGWFSAEKPVEPKTNEKFLA